ncbi:MAG: DNA-binding domain-containing protein [Deltaproteobacteria bacterium]|nr:DNA-binding domain-containing protein [Deltaproteobacteria bacterium]
MDALRATQAQLHALLRGEASTDATARILGCDPARLTIYRNFVRHHVVSVVEKNHPMSWALLGESAGELAGGFYLSHPARSWELNRAAEPFADFLEALHAAGDARVPAFAVALARFEWECFAAYADEAREPEPASLKAPTPNPTLRVLQVAFPLVDWVLEHDARASRGEPPPPPPEPLEAPETVLVFRHPERLIASYYRGSDPLLFALKVSLEGIPLEEAARQSGQRQEEAGALLERAAGLGLILLPARG